MGMFDWYRPAGALRCPLDDHPLDQWQGKNGPRLLLVWQEGLKHPIAHRLDEEVRYSPSDLEEFTLPSTFTIYSYDCPAHRPILARCATVDGTWRTTEICPLEEQWTDSWLDAHRSYGGPAGGREPARLREFTLVDLDTQMLYLPSYAREWPHERLLAWLCVWGEVRKRESTILATSGGDTYDFLSWAGLRTTFILMPDGRMFIPGTSIRAWPEHM